MAGRSAPFRWFVPILAGATWPDRVLASLGAMVGIALTAIFSRLVLGGAPGIPFLVAPVAASAVLLFAVPASPLAQPWSIIGGNSLSAATGVLVGVLVNDPIIGAAVALPLAILAMSLTRCLHPPGGAAALLGVLGGTSTLALGLASILLPVALNAVLLTLFGWAFHRLSGHPYPHRPAVPRNVHGTADAPAGRRVGFTGTDIEGALADLGETFDIDRADLDRLLRRVEARALARAHGPLLCADLMSRDVVRVRPDGDREAALRLLLEHRLRTLPVVDDGNRPLGSVGLRELTRDGPIAAVMSPPVIAGLATPVLDLVGPLTGGETHAVLVVDDAGELAGVITQTDVLAALARVRT